MKQRTFAKRELLGERTLFHATDFTRKPVTYKVYKVEEETESGLIEKIMAEGDVRFPNGNHLRVLSTRMKPLLDEVEWLVNCLWGWQDAQKVAHVPDPLALWRELISKRPPVRLTIAS